MPTPFLPLFPLPLHFPLLPLSLTRRQYCRRRCSKPREQCSQFFVVTSKQHSIATSRYRITSIVFSVLSHISSFFSSFQILAIRISIAHWSRTYTHQLANLHTLFWNYKRTVFQSCSFARAWTSPPQSPSSRLHVLLHHTTPSLRPRTHFRFFLLALIEPRSFLRFLRFQVLISNAVYY